MFAGMKIHQQVQKGITNREPALKTAIWKFNSYCDTLQQILCNILPVTLTYPFLSTFPQNLPLSITILPSWKMFGSILYLMHLLCGLWTNLYIKVFMVC